MKKILWSLLMLAVTHFPGGYTAVGTDAVQGAEPLLLRQEGVETTQAKSREEELTLTDREIRLAVQNELLASEAIKSRRVSVTVEGGVVTLFGRVRNLLDEDLAVGLAQRVRGVTSVIDQLEVNRVDRKDEDLKKDLEAAIVADPGMHNITVTVSVANGIAQIGGQVPSYGARLLVGNVVRGVAGVTGLDDQLTIDPKHTISDEDLKREITELLKYSVLLDQIHLDVAVKDGNVVFNGAVTNDFQRLSAEQLAWRVGAKDVDVRGIHIDWKHANPELRTKRYENATDDQIRNAVMLALKYDPRWYEHNDKETKANDSATDCGSASIRLD